MSNVVSLAEWKKRKDEEEIRSLQEELDSLIGELDIQPEPYFVPIDMFITGSELYGAMVRMQPTIKDCVIDLRFVSWALESLGEKEASDSINEIVEKLNTKE
jgi:hypothetical protein